MSFADCINSARKQGTITADEARAALDRFEALLKQHGDPAKAKAAMSEMLRRDATEVRRRNLLSVNANDEMLKDIANYRDANGKPRSGLLHSFDGDLPSTPNRPAYGSATPNRGGVGNGKPPAAGGNFAHFDRADGFRKGGCRRLCGWPYQR